MRNAVEVNGLIITIDNSGCIGNKELDAVQVPNEIVGYFTARTAILEQWCAGAMPRQLLMANFSGDAVWKEYEQGIRRVFSEIAIPCPPISGSSESNFDALQSALSLTMIGEKIFLPTLKNCHYFVIGQPLVGNEVIERPQLIAQLNELYQGLTEGWIQAIWPTGSKGIGAEIARFIGGDFSCAINLQASSGPSTAVLVAVLEQHLEQFLQQITAPITEILKI